MNDQLNAHLARLRAELAAVEERIRVGGPDRADARKTRWLLLSDIEAAERKAKAATQSAKSG